MAHHGGLGWNFPAKLSSAPLHSPLPAQARQGERACISSRVPLPSCQHLAHLPASGEVTHRSRVGKPGSPLLCPSSLPRVALPTSCSPCASILPSILPSVPASQSAGESILGQRVVGCILNLFCLVIFSVWYRTPSRGSWRSWRGQLLACKSSALLGCAPSARRCRGHCGPGQGCRSCYRRPGPACSRLAGCGTSSRIT